MRDSCQLARIRFSGLGGAVGKVRFVRLHWAYYFLSSCHPSWEKELVNLLGVCGVGVGGVAANSSAWGLLDWESGAHTFSCRSCLDPIVRHDWFCQVRGFMLLHRLRCLRLWWCWRRVGSVKELRGVVSWISTFWTLRALGL